MDANISVEEWCQMEQNADNPVMKFALLLKLPEICQQQALPPGQVSAVIRAVPVDLLSQLIMQDSEDVDVCLDIVLNILEALVPQGSAKDLKAFKILAEGIRQHVCSSKDKTETGLERMVSALMAIGIEPFSVDDLNSMLNSLMKFLKEHTEKFPSMTLLKGSAKCLELLSTKATDRSQVHAVTLSWPRDIRLIIQRLLQTFKLPEELVVSCYDLCNLAAQVLGPKWLRSDPLFLQLIASLTSGRLRILLEDPSKIDYPQLIACLSLEEAFIQCIEDDTDGILDEKQATSISTSCREAANFVCEYITACTKDDAVSLDMDCSLVLYRFVCAFMAIGGAEILDKETLNSAVPTLLSVCDFCINQRDEQTAGLLLINLADVERLPDRTLATILAYTRLIIPSKQSSEGLAQVCCVMEQLVDRKGWYTRESLDEARQMAEVLNDEQFSQLIGQLK